MKIVFATNNQNKLKEVQSLVPKSMQILSLLDIGCTAEIPETKNTISGNAIQKAQYVYHNFGYVCFADDTGLEVIALNGAPGAYAARYAGNQKNANDNMNKLLYNLENITNRKAQFKTVIALQTTKICKTFTGICEGEITYKKQGKNGFGYDPIFKPLGKQKTFAELSLTEKNKIGHRGKAMRQLITFLTEHY